MNATRPQITWSPTEDQIRDSRLAAFVDDVAPALAGCRNYRDVWEWSVSDPDAFWDGIWHHFAVRGDRGTGPVLIDDGMPHVSWYPDSQVNYAENALRWAREAGHADTVAIVGLDESGARTAYTWAELERRVGGLAQALRELGVMPGDRIGAVLPNTPDAVVALLASAAVGAVWSISSPELSASGTIARLAQLEPVILIGTSGYAYGGRWFDTRAQLDEVRNGLPSVRHVVVAGANARDGEIRFEDIAERSLPEPPKFEPVAFSHPLWVLFSSGTTGAPKGIVHSHGGVTLESWKINALQHDMRADDVYFVSANTSWMVWNLAVNALVAGARIVTYSGSPTASRADRQFAIIEAEGVTVFGVGAAYLTLVKQSGLTPAAEYDLSTLRVIQSTGSPLPEETWRWVHEQVRPNVHLGSESGGTDICSEFLGSNPWQPVRLGELQGPILGVSVEAHDPLGRRVIGDVGEMVITRPIPSMPLGFWGDEHGERYRAAYFDQSPGVWTHGDWISETPSGGFVIHGRSDATLNRGGVRLGTAEIYSAIETIPSVRDGVAVGVELDDGAYVLALFVVLTRPGELDDDVAEQIRRAIRSHASPRHVPDVIVAAPDIPRSHANKRLEIPVKRLVSGRSGVNDLDKAVVANPGALDWFAVEGRRVILDYADRQPVGD